MPSGSNTQTKEWKLKHSLKMKELYKSGRKIGFQKGHLHYNVGNESFKKGQSGFWLDKEFSDEHRENLSKAHKGQEAWNKGLKMPEVSEQMKGENCHWWKGGISSLVTKIRNLKENKDWKKEVFTRDNYTCQECDKRGGVLEIHHKKPFYQIFAEFLNLNKQYSPTEDQDILIYLAIKYESFWDIDNGKTLCKKYHRSLPHNDYIELTRSTNA